MSDAALSIAPGTVVAGIYRIESPIGEGGYGAVYAATQLNLGRRVALKVLHPDVITRGTALQRFRREAQLAQSLAHPNTVRLFDFGEAYGRPYIAYELLDGRSLEAVLEREGRLAPARVLRVASQTLKALMEAHDKGIVHRDIKPGNLFLCNFAGEPDFVKVLDFGIASASASEPTDKGALTQEGTTLGTPAYMSPEQALALPLDGRADVYSVGLVMSEALSGRRVFVGVTAMEILMAQASEKPVPLPEELLASPFGPLLRGATAKNRDERFQSARAMLDAVEALLRSWSTGAPSSALAPSGSVPWSAAPPSPAAHSLGSGRGPVASIATAPTAHAPLMTPPGPHSPWNMIGPTDIAAGGRTPTVAGTGSTLSASALALPAYGQGGGVPGSGVVGYGAQGAVPIVGAPPPKTGSSKLPWIMAAVGVGLLAIAGFGVWALIQYQGAVEQARSRRTRTTAHARDDATESDTSDEPAPRAPIKMAHASAPDSLPGFNVRGKTAQQILDRMESLGWKLLQQNEADIGLGPQATYTFQDRNSATAVLKLSRGTGGSPIGFVPGEKVVADKGFAVDLMVVTDDGDFFEAPIESLFSGT